MWHKALRERKKTIQPFILGSYPKAVTSDPVSTGTQLSVSKIPFSEEKKIVGINIPKFLRTSDTMIIYIIAFYLTIGSEAQSCGLLVLIWHISHTSVL